MAEGESGDPAWPLVLEWAAGARNAHRLVEADDETGERALAALGGLTEWSVLGALARHCAALVVQDWLVILGAGGEGYPGLPEVNDHEGIAGALVVAVDVLGGGFVVNGGGLPSGDPGEVSYLAPDTLDWLPTRMGHAAFVAWALDGDVDGFYADLRWPGWPEAAAALGPGQGIASYPPPFSEQGHGDGVVRRPAPLLEVWRFTRSAAVG